MNGNSRSPKFWVSLEVRNQSLGAQPLKYRLLFRKRC